MNVNALELSTLIDAGFRPIVLGTDAFPDGHTVYQVSLTKRAEARLQQYRAMLFGRRPDLIREFGV